MSGSMAAVLIAVMMMMGVGALVAISARKKDDDASDR